VLVCGFPVYVSDDVEPDTIEFRDVEGKLVGEIVNLGDGGNEQ